MDISQRYMKFLMKYENFGESWTFIVFRVSRQFSPYYMPEGEATYKLEAGEIRYMILGKMEEIEKAKRRLYRYVRRVLM